MDIVMVPVPEHLVGDVDALLFRLRFAADMPDFDPDAMREHMLLLADEPRAVLVAIAAGVVDGHPRTDADLAGEFDISRRELFGIVDEVNDVTVRPFKANLVFSVRKPDENDPSASVRQLHMLFVHAATAVEIGKELGVAPVART